MKDNKLKVSVLLATFNGEIYIREQLDSILEQEESVDEIVICDDGSTDGTMEILCSYQKKYPELIKVYQNNVNKGYAKNFWDSIKLTTGDVVIFSDQDDIWMKSKVYEIKSVFKNNKHVKALNTAYKLIDSSGKIIHTYKDAHYFNDNKLRQISFKQFVKSPKFPGMSMAIRKDLYTKDTAYKDEYLLAHDWYLNQQAAYQKGLFFLNKPLALYRQHSNNLVGVSSTIISKFALEKRLSIIKREEIMTDVLMQIYSYDKKIYSYITNVKINIIRRYLFVSNMNLLAVCIRFLFYWRFYSLRNFAGDVYAILNAYKYGE